MMVVRGKNIMLCYTFAVSQYLLFVMHTFQHTDEPGHGFSSPDLLPDLSNSFTPGAAFDYSVMYPKLSQTVNGMRVSFVL